MPFAFWEPFSIEGFMVSIKALNAKILTISLWTFLSQVATEKDFLEAVNKVIKAYAKFSATPRYMTYNW